MLDFFYRCLGLVMGIVLFGVAVAIAYAGCVSKGKFFSSGDPVILGDWIIGIVAVALFSFISYGCFAFVFR